MKILLTGSRGFIGSALSTFLKEKGHELLLLSRHPHPDCALWNPEKGELDPTLCEGVDVVINLAGENILGRWTEKKMRAIKESRLQATRLLCDTLLAIKNPPKLFLNASAIGYYGNRGSEEVTEASGVGTGFLAETCQAWEASAQKIEQAGSRLILMRFGLVLGKGGGVLKFIKVPFQMGMGGYLGDGKQIVSWIALEDLLRAVDFLFSTPTLRGAINFVAPTSLTHYEFMRLFAQTMHISTLLPIPAPLLSLVFGAGAEFFLSSIHASPQKLLQSGFSFLYPSAEAAIQKSTDIK